MKALPSLVCGLALLAPSAADGALRMYGDVKPRHFNWAAKAQMNVPLPNVRIVVDRDGCLGGGACYEHHGRGRGYLALPPVSQVGFVQERFLFTHELGHAFDYNHLSRAEQNRFRSAIGTPCGWWSGRCTIEGVNVPPAERFAEMYAFCALDLIGRDLAGYFTYGWLPTPGTEASLCSLIRSFA